MRGHAVLALAFFAALAVDDRAHAAVVQVNAATGVDSGTCGSAGLSPPCRTLTAGASRASSFSTPGGDVIQVAPGLYPEASTVNLIGEDDVEGSGSCTDSDVCTVIEPPDAGFAVLRLDPGSKASHLRVIGVTTADRLGIDAGRDTTLEDVGITMEGATNALEAVRATDSGGTVTLDHVAAQTNGDGPAFGAALPPDNLVVRDSTLVALKNSALSVNLTASTRVQRSVLRDDNHNALSTAGQTVNGSLDAGPVRIDSSLVLGGGYAVASTFPLTITNSTIDPGVAGGSDESSVVNTNAASNEPTSVSSSILLAHVTAGGPAPVSCTYTDVPNTSACPTAPGNSGHNTVNPATALFTNAAGGDYRLKPGSAAVDTGSPAGLTLAESPADLVRSARRLDGNLDCRIVRDRGAIELTGRSNRPPTASIRRPASIIRFAPASFTAVTSDDRTPAAALKLSWSFGDGAAGSGRAPSHTYTRLGAATVGLTATDATGCSAKASAAVNVLPDQVAPRISRVRVSPRRVRSRRRRMRLSFNLNEAGAVAISLQRRVRKGRRVRYRKVGSFKIGSAKVGKNTVTVPKRLVRKLRRLGRYRLSLVASDRSGNASKAARVSFRRVRVGRK
jgi:hypothetical protein